MNIDTTMLEKTGLEFGYKHCCVKHFCENACISKPHRIGYWEDHLKDNNFTGTGLVVCPECNKLPVEDVISDIDSRREVIYSFETNVQSTIAKYSDIILGRDEYPITGIQTKTVENMINFIKIYNKKWGGIYDDLI